MEVLEYIDQFAYSCTNTGILFKMALAVMFSGISFSSLFFFKILLTIFLHCLSQMKSGESHPLLKGMYHPFLRQI